MAKLKVGDWVRYTEDFCRETSTTEAGERDVASHRGQVVQVFDEGRLCNIDWRSHFTQSSTDNPSLVVSSPPNDLDMGDKATAKAKPHVPPSAQP